MRPNKVLATSTGDVSPSANPFDKRPAFQCQSSSMAEMLLQTRQGVLDDTALLAEGKTHIGVGPGRSGKKFADRDQRDSCLAHQPFTEGAILFIGQARDPGGKKIG